MSDTFTLSAEVSVTSSDAGLALEIWVDDQLITDVCTTTTVQAEINDATEAEHELRFVLKNKLPEHTVIDNDGNIVKDAVIEIKNLKFDEIELGHMFYEQAVYSHNFNGTGAETQQQFFGVMGCNGTVSLKFTTPMYLWMLEHM